MFNNVQYSNPLQLKKIRSINDLLVYNIIHMRKFIYPFRQLLNIDLYESVTADSQQRI